MDMPNLIISAIILSLEPLVISYLTKVGQPPAAGRIFSQYTHFVFYIKQFTIDINVSIFYAISVTNIEFSSTSLIKRTRSTARQENNSK